MFLFLLVLIMSGCLFEKRGGMYVFHIIWIILAAVLCFRFAQGIDYREYWMMYHYGDMHSEFLWRYGTKILHEAGIPFEVFIFCISLFMMCAIRRAVIRFSPYPCFSLLLLYPTVYYNYFFNLIRSGFVIACFLGFMLEWLIEKKYARYAAAVLVLAGVQSSTLVLLPLVFIHIMKEKILLCMAVLSSAAGFFLILTNGRLLRMLHIEKLEYYLGDVQIGTAALLEKLFLMGVVWFLYRSTKKDRDADALYRICVYGMSAAMFFAGFQMVSSRLFHLLAAPHIVAVPLMMRKMQYVGNKRLLKLVFLMYAVVITSKNINFYINAMSLNQYSIVSCPYITVFNKEKTLAVWGKDSIFSYSDGRFQ